MSEEGTTNRRLRSIVRWVCLVGLVGIGVFHFVHWWEGRGAGFRLYKIQSTPAFDKRWEVACSPEDLGLAREALSQPYHYLGHGFQVYAFMSEDGQYVLKFFRHQRLRLPKFVMALPSIPLFDEWRKSRILSLTRRQDHLFRSCKTSWDLARYETILLMVHLNITDGLYPTVTIQDLLGNTYPIELDSYQFLLQRRAQLIKPTLTALMKAGDENGAYRRIDQIFGLFLDCARKGIADTDGALVRKDNLGFFEDRAIYIDGGKLAPRKAALTKKAFVKDIKRLNPLEKWLKAEYPTLGAYFAKARSRAVEQVAVLCKESLPVAEVAVEVPTGVTG
jgi:hypothetical protein